MPKTQFVSTYLATLYLLVGRREGGVGGTPPQKKKPCKKQGNKTHKQILVKRHTEPLLLVRGEPGDKELPLGTGKTGEGFLNERALLPDFNIRQSNFVSIELHFSPDVGHGVVNLSSPANMGSTVEVDGGEK